MAGNRKGPLKISFNSPVILGFTIICFVALMLDKTTAGKTTLMFFSEYHSSLPSPYSGDRRRGDSTDKTDDNDH